MLSYSGSVLGLKQQLDFSFPTETIPSVGEKWLLLSGSSWTIPDLSQLHSSGLLITHTTVCRLIPNKLLNCCDVNIFLSLSKGKNRRLKQAKEEAQAEIEQYRLQREKDFKEKEAAVGGTRH